MPFLPRRFGALNDIASFPFFFSPLWLSRIDNVVKKEGIRLIIVRDLPMALAAMMIGKIRKIPVVLDMAECYPEFVRLIWKFEPFKLSNLFIRNPFIVDLVEFFALRGSDHIFVVVEESKDRLIKKGVPPNKITIVGNTPVMKRFQDARATFPGTINRNRGKLILLYVGLLNFSRGLEMVLRSLRQYVEIDKQVFLVMLGTGSAEKKLKEMVCQLKLEEHVGFEGWVENKCVPKYIASSDICLVPHHKCGHWNNTIPNKLFDYMAAGKPVLASDAIPVKRIMQQFDCGLIYEDHDEEKFFSRLCQLRNPEERERLGQNGIKAVRDRYNWSNDSAEMINSLIRFDK
jgi:glycosyltransferase involved in cell wall biosynthesis